MAFKLTYTDGQEDSYDDQTAWTVEDAVLKMGREAGNWTVLVSPSHWATIEVTKAGKRDDHGGDDGGGDDRGGNDGDEAGGDEKDRDTDNGKDE
jgi:hypothetical protein